MKQQICQSVREKTKTNVQFDGESLSNFKIKSFKIIQSTPKYIYTCNCRALCTYICYAPITI